MLGIMMLSIRLYACFCAAFMVVPVPTTISTTAGGAGHDPFVVDLLDVFDVNAVAGRLLEDDHRVFRGLGECLGIGVRERRNHDPDPDLEAAARLERADRALREAVEEFADGR